MGSLAELYNHLPLPLQNASISLYGIYWHWLRFGGNYVDLASRYHAREWLSTQEWAVYQKQKLIELLEICAKQVPYYTRTWSSQQKRAASHGDLAVLPLLSKEPLRQAPYDFVRKDHSPVIKIKNWTSGSTGTPIASIWTPEEMRDSLAVREVRSANWAGVSFSMPRATFSGRIVEPSPDSQGPYYRYNAIEKQVYFSAFHLKPDTAKKYVDALCKHQIAWMTGYAVSYYLLARFILEQGIQVPPLKAVITTSEKLTHEMRSVMEKAYHCQIYEEYSTVENALFASECEHGRLHVSPDVGIVEILRPDGSPCHPGEVGEVVTTCLMRTYQPLVRYRLGDLAAWDSEPCSCGRAMPVLKEVVGRIEDVITGPDGRQMVRFHGIFVDQPHVIEGQIIQESLDHVHVKVVTTDEFNTSDEMDIQQRLNRRLGKSILVTIEKVTHIPRGANGKFKAVISRVAR